MDATIGNRFKRARVAAEMTQGEVARHFGVDRGTVYRWERGDSRIDLQVLIDAVALFGCEREWLVFGDGQAPRVRSEWDVEPDDAANSEQGGSPDDDSRPREGAA